MKSSDLMLGDWVRAKTVDYVDGVIKYVEENKRATTAMIHQLYNQETGVLKDSLYSIQVEPIELTPEILLKNGFNKDDYLASQCYGREANHSVYSLLLENGNQVVTLDYCNKKIELEVATNAGRCLTIANGCYIHELQHAIKLCRIDKEIIL